MRAVLDTNVLISACLKPDGLEARTVALALSGAFLPCLSPPIWAEYVEVFNRRKFAALVPRSQPMLAAIKIRALPVNPVTVVSAATDPDDNRFLECAQDGGADFLITGNLRHYPPQWGRTSVVNARGFLEANFRSVLQQP